MNGLSEPSGPVKPEPDIPVVNAEFIAVAGPNNDRQRWHIRACPYCDAKHWHGAGPRGADPSEFGFIRRSHCADPDIGGWYRLRPFTQPRYNTKLTAGEVIAIRVRLEQGERPKELGREFKVHPGHISRIKHARQWKCLASNSNS